MDDYIKRGKFYPPHPNHLLFDLDTEIKKVLNFIPTSFQELKYCITHNVKEPNRCIVCGKYTEFLDNVHGFKKFCSRNCSTHYQNRQKEPRLSPLSDDEIRKVILTIKPDNRNLTTSALANVWLNIERYSKEFDIELTNPEKVYVFLNKLTSDDVLCPYCKKHKRLFKSQTLGFRPTCGGVDCIKIHKGHKNRHPANGTTMSDLFNKRKKYGFIYLLQLENTNIFKIGISNHVIRRFRNIKSIEGIKDIKIICSIMIKDYRYHEKILHEHFKNKQVDFNSKFDGYSESFNLEHSDLKYFKDYLTQYITDSINETLKAQT